MIKLRNLRDNDNMISVAKKGCFEVYEHQKDLSVAPLDAATAYFMHEMNYKKRQLFCNMNGNSVKVQAGAMQWMAGDISMVSGVSGVKDFLGKALKGAVTGESTAKPLYSGTGYVMLEPTYRYIILEDISTWGGGIVLDDGLFLACESSLKEEVVARTNISSALLGGEGLFNLSLSGNGIAALESSVPREELIEIELENDVVKIDGNMAIAWSRSLNFTVEKSGKTALGSMVSGEGFVNVYRGTGKILLTPTAYGTLMKRTNTHEEAQKSSSDGIVGSVVSSIFG